MLEDDWRDRGDSEGKDDKLILLKNTSTIIILVVKEYQTV